MSLINVSSLSKSFGAEDLYSSVTFSVRRVHGSWLSIYNAEITSLYLPQLSLAKVRMMLVNPERVAFGMA